MARKNRSQTGTVVNPPERFPLIGTSMYRKGDRTKDQRFINCFQESIKNEVTDSKRAYLVKRSGTSLNTTVVAGTARAYIYWNNKHYSIIDNKLYSNTTSIQTINTSTGQCGFAPFDANGNSYLFLADGTDAWVIDTSDTVARVNATISAWVASTAYSVGSRVIPTVANGYYYEVTATSGTAPYTSGGTQPTWPITIGSTVTDNELTWTCAGEYGGFPTPHIPTPKYVDGYMLLPAANSQDIYNSDVENVFGWGAGNFVSAEMWPDNIVGLARQNNQVLALGETSSEFFYDAAATGGSPFSRNEGTVMQIGCAAPYAVFEQERFCLFIGKSDSGGRAVWLVEGFQPKKVSNEAIERVLDQEANIASVRGYGLRTKGHLFYVICLAAVALVYDVEEKVWHEWTYNNSGSHAAWPFTYCSDLGSGKVGLLHTSNGKIYTLDPTVYQDDGLSILMEAYTLKYDNNSMNRKFMHNLYVVGDETTNTVAIRWSDDDYTTWNAYKDLSGDRPYFARCGAFRRRAFNIKFTANEDARYETIEFELDDGVH